MRACCCLDLQIKCLEAGASSSIGYSVIKYLQEDRLEKYHSGTYEEKEAFQATVKATEKQFLQDRTASARTANMTNSGSFTAKRGMTMVQSMQAKTNVPVQVQVNNSAGTKGGKKGKKGKKFNGICFTCNGKGHKSTE